MLKIHVLCRQSSESTSVDNSSRRNELLYSMRYTVFESYFIKLRFLKWQVQQLVQ